MISQRGVPLLLAAAGTLFLACAVDAPFAVEPSDEPPEAGPNLPPSSQGDGGTDAADEVDATSCQDGGGECVPGEARMGSCGRCGTRPEKCSSACVWVGGACSDEKICNPDDLEVQSGNNGCTHPRQVRTRKCSSACDWPAWSECVFSGWSRTPSIAPDTVEMPDWTMWTGQELVLRGAGCVGSIHAYNPATDALRAVVDPLPGKDRSTWTWTGTRAFVFGGVDCGDGAVEQNGALLDVTTGALVRVTGPGGFTEPPVLGAWIPTTGDVVLFSSADYENTPPPPRAYRVATRAWRVLAPTIVKQPKNTLWTGTRLLVTGLCGDFPKTQCVDSLAPTTGVWTPLSLPEKLKGAKDYEDQGLTVFSTSLGLVFWGAFDKATSANIGAIFDEATSTWTTITAPAPAVLESGVQSAFWAHDKLWVWTGGTLGPGAKWDPATKAWSAMPLGGPDQAPMPARSTGSDVIFWGGRSTGSRGWVFHP